MNHADLAVFVNAIRFGSLAAAARRLGVTPMAASRRLAALELDLGVRLVQRSTRALSLTSEGEAFLPHAEALLEAAANARAVVRPPEAGAEGLLRVTATTAFGRTVIAPMLPALLQANPELRVDLDLNDTVVDIVAQGIDLAIRIAPLRDNRLIAHRLGDSRRILCAAPSYLARHCAPHSLADLPSRQCLLASGATHWLFDRAGRTVQQRVSGRVTSTSIEALHEAALGGLGIALLSQWYVEEDLRLGRLVELPLTDAAPERFSIWAIYPTAQMVPSKVRVFVAALAQALS
jgi:DNA-binding transcriptional LysR family regulator